MAQRTTERLNTPSSAVQHAFKRAAQSSASSLILSVPHVEPAIRAVYMSELADRVIETWGPELAGIAAGVLSAAAVRVQAQSHTPAPEVKS